MASNVTYMVDNRGKKPDLVRCLDGVFERYDPRVESEWEGSKLLDALGYGGGDWVWYDDIPESDVEFYKDKIRAFWKERGELKEG